MQTPFISGLVLVSTLLLGACGGSSSGSPSSSQSSINTSSSSSSSVVALHTLADFPIGVAVSAADEPSSILKDDAAGAAQRQIIETHFNQLTAGNIMKMSYLHPTRETYNFTEADRLL